MHTMKTLMLAGIAALSIGTGTALAQSDGASMIGPNDYWTQQQRALYAHPAQSAVTVQPEAGSSDVTPADHGLDNGWGGDRSPFRFDYGTLANPG